MQSIENEKNRMLLRPGYWALFLLYLIVLFFSISHHELWGDELHSWNITKASTSYTDLIRNIRYEGHPPLWYSLMWLVTRFSHNLVYLQALQYVLAGSFTFLFLFFAPFPRLAKCVVPFGYYFLFEYGTLSRNYAGALVLVFALCILLQPRHRNRVLLYYILLFLLANTHLLGAVLAASVHVWRMLNYSAEHKARPRLWIQLLSGVLVLIPSLYFIFPPSDSEMNMQFWIDRWNRQQLVDIAEAPVRSFIPVPAWWQYHFWNTEFLVSLKAYSFTAKVLVTLLSLSLVVVVAWLLKKDRQALCLFLFNFLITCLVAAIFPLNSARYVGFIFISFIVAVWLYLQRQGTFSYRQKIVLYVLLFIQVVAAAVALSRDFRDPFSNAGKVKELADLVPPKEHLVTDYWCLNNLAAFMDKPFYCIELNQELSYILWDQKMAAAMKAATPYANGFDHYFKATGLKEVFLLSVNSPQRLASMEPEFARFYRVQLVAERAGAIEKYGNLYFYKVSPKNLNP